MGSFIIQENQIGASDHDSDSACRKNHTELLKNAGAGAVRNFVTINQLFFRYVLLDFTYIFKHTAHACTQTKRESGGGRNRAKDLVCLPLLSSSSLQFLIRMCSYWPALFNLLYQCQHLYFIAERNSLAYTRTHEAKRHEKKLKTGKVNIIYRLADCCTYSSLAYMYQNYLVLPPLVSLDSLRREQESLFSLPNLFCVSYIANLFFHLTTTFFFFLF